MRMLSAKVLLNFVFLAGSVSLVLAWMDPIDPNSDPNVQMAHQASVPFDGIVAKKGNGASVGVKVASGPSAQKGVRVASVEVAREVHAMPVGPSAKPKNSEEALEKQAKAAVGAMVAGWFLAVTGSLAGWPILAGVGLGAFGLGIILFGSIFLRTKDKEMHSVAGRVFAGSVLAAGVGVGLLSAAILGAPGLVGTIGGALLAGGTLTGLISGMVAMAQNK